MRGRGERYRERQRGRDRETETGRDRETETDRQTEGRKEGKRLREGEGGNWELSKVNVITSTPSTSFHKPKACW